MKLVNFNLKSVNEELPAILLDNGDWLFSGNETCIFGELASKKNAASWVKNNIPSKWVVELKVPGKDGRPGLYLTKPGFYYAICNGKSMQSMTFRDEVFEVILPQIDIKGGYIAESATSEQVEALVEEYKTQRNLAQEDAAKLQKQLGDLSIEFQFVEDKSIPKLKKFIRTISNICSDLERGLYTDAGDILDDSKMKRYKTVKDVEKMAMLSTKASIVELRRACESLKSEEFAGLTKTLERLSNQFEN